ncbi:hypothetical protein [Micromonospora humi]|uniref:hypothetical protein n=1 Tax=Micromonospora humi TaxID=745366 RepID=UPI000B86D98D|nr:hypothetical protein [Micromonospora humi]
MKKRCSMCGETKPLDQFAVSRRRTDGRITYCKPCKKVYNEAYYQRTRDRHNPSRAARRDQHRAENAPA